MATAVLPRRRRMRRARSWGDSARKTAVAALRLLLTPARPVLRNLVNIPFTGAGLGCIDYGVFTANQLAGFLVTGASLVLLEHLIADEVDQ